MKYKDINLASIDEYFLLNYYDIHFITLLLASFEDVIELGKVKELTPND